MSELREHLTPDDLDAALEGSLANQVVLHLETCTSCQDLLEAERAVIALSDGLDPPTGARLPLRGRRYSRRATSRSRLRARVVRGLDP